MRSQYLQEHLVPTLPADPDARIPQFLYIFLYTYIPIFLYTIPTERSLPTLPADPGARIP